MAATPEQQRRYQAALRRVLKKYRDEDEAKYQRLLAEALAEEGRRRAFVPGVGGNTEISPVSVD